jgi:hypothetical protein
VNAARLRRAEEEPMDVSAAKKLTHAAAAAAAFVLLGAVSCPPPKPTDPNQAGSITLNMCFANASPNASFNLPQLCWSGALAAGTGGLGQPSFQGACSPATNVPAPTPNPVCASAFATDLAKGTWQVTLAGGPTCPGVVTAGGGSVTVNADGSCSHVP